MQLTEAFRYKESAHVALRTTDVVLGVECALPAGFEACGPGPDARSSAAAPRAMQRWLASVIILIGLCASAWYIMC